MSLLPPTRTETPTQYDLARWLFERIAAVEGEPKDRDTALALMHECLSVVRPEEKPRQRERP